MPPPASDSVQSELRKKERGHPGGPIQPCAKSNAHNKSISVVSPAYLSLPRPGKKRVPNPWSGEPASHTPAAHAPSNGNVILAHKTAKPAAPGGSNKSGEKNIVLAQFRDLVGLR